jgi:hypothetical protein
MKQTNHQPRRPTGLLTIARYLAQFTAAVAATGYLSLSAPTFSTPIGLFAWWIVGINSGAEAAVGIAEHVVAIARRQRDH